MAGRSSRKGAPGTAKAAGGAKQSQPTSTPTSPTPDASAAGGARRARSGRATARVLQRRGRAEILGGSALVVAGLALALLSSGPARYALVYLPIAIGVAAIVIGAVRLSPPAAPGLAPHPDLRRWIYGGLDLLFGAVFAVVIAVVIPTRLPSAAFHLWTLPACTLVMGAGTLLGGRHGWWSAIGAGSVLLLSTIILIVRILISAAFLAGVYGAFGKAASTFALISVALIVELVALLPIVQIKFLMTRAGRRAYGM